MQPHIFTDGKLRNFRFARLYFAQSKLQLIIHMIQWPRNYTSLENKKEWSNNHKKWDKNQKYKCKAQGTELCRVTWRRGWWYNSLVATPWCGFRVDIAHRGNGRRVRRIYGKRGGFFFVVTYRRLRDRERERDRDDQCHWNQTIMINAIETKQSTQEKVRFIVLYLQFDGFQPRTSFSRSKITR